MNSFWKNWNLLAIKESGYCGLRFHYNGFKIKQENIEVIENFKKLAVIKRFEIVNISRK